MRERGHAHPHLQTGQPGAQREITPPLDQSHRAGEGQFLNTVSEAGTLIYSILGHNVKVFSRSTGFTPVLGGRLKSVPGGDLHWTQDIYMEPVLSLATPDIRSR